MMDASDIGDTVVFGNRIEWTLNDFFSQAPEKTFISSKFFYFKRKEFYFVLEKPRIREEWNHRSWVGVHLSPLSLGESSEYSVHFSIRKECGEEIKSSKASYVSPIYFNPQFMRWDTLVENKDELVPNGNLTIVCRIHEVGEEPAKKKLRLDEAAVEDATTSVSASEFKDLVSLRDGFKAMFESGEFCDFDVKVQDRIFRTHRMVLSALSSVFASMLRHDMQEKKTGMMEIVDCDSETFEAFLKFLYGGKNEIIILENVVSLYEVANKYNVQNLKAECRRFMMKNLSTELLCDVICLALKHEERELIKHATKYFKLNKENIILTEQWQIFVKENSTYVIEFLIKAC